MLLLVGEGGSAALPLLPPQPFQHAYTNASAAEIRAALLENEPLPHDLANGAAKAVRSEQLPPGGSVALPTSAPARADSLGTNDSAIERAAQRLIAAQQLPSSPPSPPLNPPPSAPPPSAPPPASPPPSEPTPPWSPPPKAPVQSFFQNPDPAGTNEELEDQWYVGVMLEIFGQVRPPGCDTRAAPTADGRAHSRGPRMRAARRAGAGSRANTRSRPLHGCGVAPAAAQRSGEARLEAGRSQGERDDGRVLVLHARRLCAVRAVRDLRRDRARLHRAVGHIGMLRHGCARRALAAGTQHVGRLTRGDKAQRATGV